MESSWCQKCNKTGNSTGPSLFGLCLLAHMGSIGKCNICNEHVLYRPDEVASLGKHHIHKHQDMQVSYIALDTQSPEAGPDTLCTCDCDCGCKCAKAKPGRRSDGAKVYKTTVESWKKGPHEITCPQCGFTDIPLIKTQRNKLAKSSLGAFMLLGCWPICFLPFILGGSDLMSYYCKNCGQLLYTNNRKDGKRVAVVCDIPNASEGRPQACECAKIPL